MSFALSLEDIQNHRVYGLYASSGIINNRKRNVSESGSVSVLRRVEGDIYTVGFLRKR
jgi:hypothetical protein